MTPNHSLINRLPEEVWDIVLDYVELKDLRKVARVNTMFAKHARSGHPDSHPPEVDDSDCDFLIEDYDSDDYWEEIDSDDYWNDVAEEIQFLRQVWPPFGGA